MLAVKGLSRSRKKTSIPFFSSFFLYDYLRLFPLNIFYWAMHIKEKEHSLLKNTTSYIVIRLSWCQALSSMNFISPLYLIPFFLSQFLSVVGRFGYHSLAFHQPTNEPNPPPTLVQSSPSSSKSWWWWCVIIFDIFFSNGGDVACLFFKLRREIFNGNWGTIYLFLFILFYALVMPILWVFFDCVFFLIPTRIIRISTKTLFPSNIFREYLYDAYADRDNIPLALNK